MTNYISAAKKDKMSNPTRADLLAQLKQLQLELAEAIKIRNRTCHPLPSIKFQVLIGLFLMSSGNNPAQFSPTARAGPYYSEPDIPKEHLPAEIVSPRKPFGVLATPTLFKPCYDAYRIRDFSQPTSSKTGVPWYGQRDLCELVEWILKDS